MTNYEWVQTSAPKQNRHDDIWFTSATEGWTVNSAGQILKTNDAGLTWSEQVQTGHGSYLRCIAFSDSSHGWVGSTTRASRLWQTNDGGKSWKKVTNLPPEPSAVCGLWVVDRNLIYAAGTNFPNRPTAILKTTDGGITWTSQAMDQHADLLVDIFFIDSQTGWVVGGKGGDTRKDITPVVLYTEDGGNNWINQLKNQSITFPKGEWGWKIHFLSHEVGFVSLENFNDGAILKTSDGGKTWTRHQINDNQKNANLEGIGFLNETTGWVGGWGDSDFKGGYTSETIDGGKTWSDANHVGRFINRFRFTGDQEIVAYASGDSVYRYQRVGTLPQMLSPIIEAHTAEKALPVFVSEPSCEMDASVTFGVNVPVGTVRLTVEVWNRFAGYIIELEDTLNPPPGLHSIAWKFTGIDGKNLDDSHFIIRTTIDNRAESRIIQKPKR